MDNENLNSSEVTEKEQFTENNTDTENALINEQDNETSEEDELQREIEELEAEARKQFKIGMTIMVVSQLITLVCALTESYMNSHYSTNPIISQLDFIVQTCSYAFYLGLIFIIRYYIARRKIPKD